MYLAHFYTGFCNEASLSFLCLFVCFHSSVNKQTVLQSTCSFLDLMLAITWTVVQGVRTCMHAFCLGGRVQGEAGGCEWGREERGEEKRREKEMSVHSCFFSCCLLVKKSSSLSCHRPIAFFTLVTVAVRFLFLSFFLLYRVLLFSSLVVSNLTMESQQTGVFRRVVLTGGR